MSKINIRKRNNYYEYRIEIAQIEGKRKWISKSGFRTKQEAQEAGTIAYNEYLNAGVPLKNCNLSYSDYLDYWLENYCKSNLKYNTVQTYSIIIRKYLKPYVGKYKLSTVTSVSLNEFVINIVNNYNCSRSYYKNILKVLKGSFRDACNLYGFIKYNPALTIRLPKINQYSEDIKHLYTEKEIDMILERFKENKTFILAFLTSYYTGMRIGEVFALTWNDIDIEKGIINIEHSIYDKPKDEKGRWYLGSTKTHSSIRKVYIGNILKQAFINYKKRQNYLKEIYGSQYNNYHLENVLNESGKLIEKRIVLNKNTEENINLIFTKDDGTYIGTDLTKYPFKIIHNELGINKCRFHDLRGTYATKILNNGTQMKEISTMLGHNNILTTENYYISSIDENKKKLALEFEKNIQSQKISNIINFYIDNV